MKTHDLVVKTGEYEVNGEKKNRYMNIGAMMTSEKGPYILIDKTFNPAGIQDGKNRILVSIFEVREKQTATDEIPF